MKIHRVIADNFGSYSHVKFDFEGNGLALIQGVTGSGKSTLFDMPLWALYGVTAKDGAVDEVRSWNNLEKPTIVILELDDIIITRIRGKANENDLFWTEKGSDLQRKRGKDLQDTQKALTARLGIGVDIYCAATYFNEFSPQNFFFLARPKEKRDFLESIIDFSLPVKLAEKAAKEKKSTKEVLSSQQKNSFFFLSKLEHLKERIEATNQDRNEWQNKHASFLYDLQIRAEKFGVEKSSKIAALETRLAQFKKQQEKKLNDLERQLESLISTISDSPMQCPTCNQKMKAQERAKLNSVMEAIEATKAQVSPIVEQLEEAKSLRNHHLDRINEESNLKNPYDKQILQLKKEYSVALDNHNKAKDECDKLEQKINDIDYIYDLSFELRGLLLQNMSVRLEEETNRILEKYFNTEFRIELKIKGADTLDVEILRGGTQCSYTQLSKGQRGLLKLAFAVGLMKTTAETQGVKSNTLFFDEALDGLDADLKTKSFSLFHDLSLSYENVFVIDHSQELQQMFDVVYTAELINGCTDIKKQS